MYAIFFFTGWPPFVVGYFCIADAYHIIMDFASAASPFHII